MLPDSTHQLPTSRRMNKAARLERMPALYGADGTAASTRGESWRKRQGRAPIKPAGKGGKDPHRSSGRGQQARTERTLRDGRSAGTDGSPRPSLGSGKAAGAMTCRPSAVCAGL